MEKSKKSICKEGGTFARREADLEKQVGRKISSLKRFKDYLGVVPENTAVVSKYICSYVTGSSYVHNT